MPFRSTGHFFSKRPWLISTVLFLSLSLWLGFGMLKADDDIPTQQDVEIPLAKVIYQSFDATLTEKKIELYGRTAPDRIANIGAESAGRVVNVRVSKGDSVKKGQAIAQIDQGDLAIQLERTEALLKLKEKEFKASESLKNRGLQGEVAFTTAQAGYTEAKAMVKNAELALSNTLIKAPFSGVIDSLHIEVGDYVSIGDPIANLIDLNNLVIEADVSERHIQSLSLNQPATIRFINGERAEGSIRYISRMSSPSTNTFPVEIVINNRDQSIPAGMSAEVELTLDELTAVKVTPAMLALDEKGNLGVKILVDKRAVKFVPIQLVKAEQDGVWLSGLGDTVDIITVGQGFVREGDDVIGVDQNTIRQSVIDSKTLSVQSAEPTSTNQ